jgi:hypothetical protein
MNSPIEVPTNGYKTDAATASASRDGNQFGAAVYVRSNRRPVTRGRRKCPARSDRWRVSRGLKSANQGRLPCSSVLRLPSFFPFRASPHQRTLRNFPLSGRLFKAGTASRASATGPNPRFQKAVRPRSDSCGGGGRAEKAMRHTVRQCVTFDDFMGHMSHDELFAICPCFDDIYQEPPKTCVTLQYRWPSCSLGDQGSPDHLLNQVFSGVSG